MGNFLDKLLGRKPKETEVAEDKEAFTHPTLGKMWPIIFPEGGGINIFDKTQKCRATGACFRLLEPIYMLDGEYYLGPIEQGRNISTSRTMPFRPYVNIIAYEGIINLQ